MKRKIIIFVVMFCLLTASGFTFIDLSKVGLKLEKKAKTEADFRKVVDVYSKYLQLSSPSENKEKKAKVQYAIALILEKKLTDTKEAVIEYKNILRHFPQSLYSKKAKESLKRINLNLSKSKLITTIAGNKKKKWPLIIPYDPKKLTSDHIEKVSIQDMKKAIKKAKILQEKQEFLLDFDDEIESGLTYLQDLFYKHGISEELIEHTSYLITVKGQDINNEEISIKAGMSLDTRFLLINDKIGVMVESKRELLYFPEKKQFHVIDENSSDEIRDLYRKILDMYSGLMYFNGKTEYLWVGIIDPLDEELERTDFDEDKVTLGFFPINEESGYYLQLDLDFSLSPTFVSEIKVMKKIVPDEKELDSEGYEEPLPEVQSRFKITELRFAPTIIPNIDSFQSINSISPYLFTGDDL